MRTPAALACALTVALLCAAPAHADPTRLAWSTTEDTSISDLAISEDGRWVAFVADGSGNVRFLDTGSWEVVGDTAVCSSATVGGVAIAGDDGDYQVFAGCSDGTVVGLTLDRAGATGDLWEEPVALADAGAVLAVETDGESVYAIAEQDGGNERVHRIGVDSAAEDTTSYPSTFGQSGFADSWLGSSYLFVSHDGQKVSKVDLSSGSIATSTENLAGRQMGDMYAVSDSAAFLADADGGLIRFNPGGLDFDILLDDDDGLVSNQAVAIDDTEGWLALYDAGVGEVVLYEFSGLACGDEEQARFPTDDIVELVVGDGYTIGGGGAGALQVLTDRPWVETGTVSPSQAVADDTVTVTFTVDEDGEWSLYLGGDGTTSGTLLDSGSAEADVQTEASFVVDEGFEEGDNELWLLAGSASLRGHDRTSVSVDNPPAAPYLTADGVGFGNQQLTVTFDGITDADLASYTVYCTVTEFSAEDYPTGGPQFDGEDEVEGELPVSVEGSPGEAVTVTIQPLTNDVTYYVAVRAYDKGGKESEMSNVLSATPRETVGAAGLAGEQGGYCGTNARWGLGALALAGLLGLRRRRLAVVAVAALAVAPSALAARDREHPRQHANVELRFGPYFPSSEAMQTVYGDNGRGLLQLEGGAKITRFFEADLGAGFYQDLGTLVSVDDHAHSAEHTMITAWPFTASLGARLHFINDQFLVPTAEIGLDYWLWRENWYVNDTVGGDSSVSGGELGWHWGAGVNLLLDNLDKRHAAALESHTGIHDTYLVIDWRTQTLGQWRGDGTSLFDGSMVTFGIKVDM
ncbi:MAG: MXAN_2562 family outer membrane beta-barrel protein [Pseudomonadota bacterium]